MNKINIMLIIWTILKLIDRFEDVVLVNMITQTLCLIFVNCFKKYYHIFQFLQYAVLFTTQAILMRTDDECEVYYVRAMVII
jgi:hypothetical protein